MTLWTSFNNSVTQNFHRFKKKPQQTEGRDIEREDKWLENRKNTNCKVLSAISSWVKSEFQL
jgi:hypothetical protein